MALNETTNNNPRKERFEFRLTVNNNIICQRYFRINGLNPQSLCSIDLVKAIDECVNMIHEDLKAKTQIYLEYTAPQLFDNLDEMKDLISKGHVNLHDMTFITFRDSDDAYYYSDGVFTPYDKPISKLDYVSDPDQPQQEVVFKFAFYDSGYEKFSKIWDGTVYPRFVRTNVDLSNSKNKYRQDGNFSSIEKFLIDKFNEDREDLIPKIVKEIYTACSREDSESYTTEVSYGNTTYELDLYKLMLKNASKYRTDKAGKTKKSVKK